MADEFYILSPKWTREGTVTWWGPNNSGYTWLIEHAGRYSREQVESIPDYYNNGVGALAIPCEAVDAVAVRVVLREQLEDLTGKRFKRVTDQEDDIQACEACGCEPHPTDLGLRVAEPGSRKEVSGG